MTVHYITPEQKALAEKYKLSPEAYFAPANLTNGDVAEILEGIRDRILQLQERIEQLEQKQIGPYCGDWTEGTTYERGSLVTCGGSLWHANVATHTRPHVDNSLWTIAVKRGRDAPRRPTAPRTSVV